MFGGFIPRPDWTDSGADGRQSPVHYEQPNSRPTTRTQSNLDVARSRGQPRSCDIFPEAALTPVGQDRFVKHVNLWLTSYSSDAPHRKDNSGISKEGNKRDGSCLTHDLGPRGTLLLDAFLNASQKDEGQ